MTLAALSQAAIVRVEPDEVPDRDVGDALFGDQPADVADARAELAGESRDVYSVVKVSAAIGMVGGHDVVSILGTWCPRDDR
jgi:hypothetical protein